MTTVPHTTYHPARVSMDAQVTVDIQSSMDDYRTTYFPARVSLDAQVTVDIQDWTTLSWCPSERYFTTKQAKAHFWHCEEKKQQRQQGLGARLAIRESTLKYCFTSLSKISYAYLNNTMNVGGFYWDCRSTESVSPHH